MKRVAALFSAVVMAAIGLVSPLGASTALASGIPGRSDNQGYFYNQFRANGDFVLTNGLYVSDVASLESQLIDTDLAGKSTAASKTGAEFIVLTMLDYKPGTPKSVAHDPAVIANWKKTVESYAANGQIIWNMSVTFYDNTLWQGGTTNGTSDGGPDDVAGFTYAADDPHTSQVIVFENPDGTRYEIKRNCGNPVGVLNGLQSAAAAIDGIKMDTGGGTAGAYASAQIKLNGSITSTPTPTSNPFFFQGLTDGATYAVSAPAVAGYTLKGSTWCYDSTAGCGGPSATLPNTSGPNFKAGSSVNLKVKAGDTIHMRWVYQPNVVPPSTILHKIYGANTVLLNNQYVRDNYTFPYQLGAYLWPDAGLLSRPSDKTKHLWLAGVWGDKTHGGPSSNNTSPQADVNIMTTVNNKAEVGCPTGGGCLDRIPLAYVPQSLGGSDTTPNGNNWLSIVQRTLNQGYSPQLGGMASTDNSTVGGLTGNHVKQVEISNIHVIASGVTSTLGVAGKGQALQGAVSPSTLQDDSLDGVNPQARQLDMPAASQGPITGGVWDNIRNPNKANSGFTLSNLCASTCQDANVPPAPGGLPNFTDNPNQPTSLASKLQGIVFASGNVTSLLQDGNGNGYSNSTEPLTLTAGIQSASDVQLGWDEYVNWDQVDDKGHYYTTRGTVPTGISQGNPTSGQTATLYSIGCSGPNGCGYQVRTVLYWTCVQGNSTWIVSDPSDAPLGYSCSPTYNYTSASPVCVTGTYVQMSQPNPVYYAYNVEGQYGWINSSATLTGSIPYGGSGGRSGSYFAGYTSSNPPWATNANVLDMWQDRAITPMSRAGASSTTTTTNPGQWTLDRTDPMYSWRWVFDSPITWTNYTGYSVVGQSCVWVYPNGSYSTSSYSVSIPTYYPNWNYLYENSASAVNPVGRYNFTANDGSEDGVVDTGWAWASNKQRVQYEQTWTDHSRDLGARQLAPAGSANCLLNDNFFLGTNAASGQSCMQVARGMSTIYNPVIGTTSGDIYAGGGIGSYFTNSTSTAYLFSGNGVISQFTSKDSGYPNYANNNDPQRVGLNYNGNANHAAAIFPNLSHMENIATPIGTSMSGNFNLSGKTYIVNGDLTINAAVHFCNGAGTIIVTGNLIVRGNIDYNNCPGPFPKDLLPSVGFIVLGSGVSPGIFLNSGVTTINGTYFTNGVFDDDSVLGSAGLTPVDRSLGDNPLDVQGLVIANNFNLLRQPLGTTLQANGNISEQFNYDGRVVVNTPPGFDQLLGSAAWGLTVPVN